MTTVPLLVSNLTEEQQAVFHTQMSTREKDQVAGVLLALFLGGLGAHHFYLRRTGLGVTYLLLCWTAIPAVLGVIECFFMPSRVERYNLEQASLLAAALRGASYAALPGAYGNANPYASPAQREQSGTVQCNACGAASLAGARFCAKCGAALAA